MDRKKIAAIVTTYFSRSHADLIVSKFLRGFDTPNGLIEPKVDVVSMYIDQVHPKDVGLEIAQQYGVEIFPSIHSALTRTKLTKGHWPTASDWTVGELAVDGVLLIAEHGDYASNEQGRQIYPRRSFFEQITGVIGVSNRPIPVFNDKHLSYNWPDAHWMYKRANELNMPLMAGSSLPLTTRIPFLEHPIGERIDQAFVLGHFNSYPNGLDSYGFHGLEALQAMVERRSGGETGIRSVQCLEGDAVWEAGEEGVWPRDLAELVAGQMIDKDDGHMQDNCINPAIFLIEYVDGFRASVILLYGHVRQIAYAASVAREVLSTVYGHGSKHLDDHFTILGLNIQEMFLTGMERYPVERTLLTTGAHDALMESRFRGHIVIETPHLNIGYSPSKLPMLNPF